MENQQSIFCQFEHWRLRNVSRRPGHILNVQRYKETLLEAKVHKRKLKNQSFLSCSGTSLKEHLWNEGTWLIRTLDWVPTSYKYILFSYWNKDTSLIRTIIFVPVTTATNESWTLFPSLPLMNYVALMQYRRRSSELKCYQANVEGYM